MPSLYLNTDKIETSVNCHYRYNIQQNERIDHEKERHGEGIIMEGPSCSALKHAVSRLYRMDDFFSEKLAYGFFADVYKVIHKTTGKVMVMKVNSSGLDRVNALKEVQILNSLKHSNVIKLLGVCVHQGLLHALTEFANGGCLEEMVQNLLADISWPTWINIACDVTKGMSHIHSKGIMHRDLTSKNIFIRIDNNQHITAVVGDLGLATKIPDIKDGNVHLPVVGSAYWMAPECITGKKRYDEKADVFSYGIILCEMIGRISADPDILPRTKNFGVDYVAFSRIARDCPVSFLHYTFKCCQIDSMKRPSFLSLLSMIEIIQTKSLKATVVADISRFSREGETVVMTRKILEKILDDRESQDRIIYPQRNSVTLQKPDNLTQLASETVKGSNNGMPVVRLISEKRISGDLVSIDSKLVGQVMSEDDLFYAPCGKNPFSDYFF